MELDLQTVRNTKLSAMVYEVEWFFVIFILPEKLFTGQIV